MQHKLFTKPIEAQLVKNFKDRMESGAEAEKPVVKLFTPFANCTWLLTEFDPATGEAFGLCDLGMGFPELGYVSIPEICSATKIERDAYWTPKLSLSEYADKARNDRGIYV